jgi:hypothetical protein
MQLLFTYIILLKKGCTLEENRIINCIFAKTHKQFERSSVKYNQVVEIDWVHYFKNPNQSIVITYTCTCAFRK